MWKPILNGLLLECESLEKSRKKEATRGQDSFE